MADKPNPTDARTYYHRGNDLYEAGSYEKSIEAYNMAIILNPTFSEAYFNRGLCHYNLKNFDKSIEDYSKSVDLDPKNPVIYNNRGDAYYRKQLFDKAIADYDRALDLNPKYLKAFYNRGLAYACQQDYEKAVEDFSEVIKINPSFAEAYHIRGLAYDYLNQLDKAIADYDKAIELNPNFTEAISHRDIAKGKQVGGGAPDNTAGGAPGQNQGINAVKLLQKPNMKFVDVAGMHKMKEEINESIIYPLVKPELARKYGKFAGGGIMLYGPPGCGKTFIVKAAAGECEAAFINAKISDVLDMYVGNTEKNIHNVFETARKNCPCILFFDEMEALGGRREEMSQSTQYMRMAVNQMLFEMDGVEANNQNVLVIGATNAPWDVDPALRRSGRFGKAIFIPEPDYRSRLEIIKMHARKVPASKWVSYARVARATTGYASADLKALVEEAAAIPWREAFKNGKQREVTNGDFMAALKKKKSSLPPWYEQAKKQIGTQEEKTVVDGKEHIKVTESKMAAAEKEAFKELLDVIKKRNEIWYKGYIWFMKYFNIYVPLPI
ncbi:tetratricopeptide repeat protein [Candidatus Micrarchaeota archaeon]|nr:tetratricopeptide repeat protein [Candidatus Micrarchaeota archaeon]